MTVLHWRLCLLSANDFGLFLADDDPKKGVWLDKKHNFEYYLLRNGVSVTSPPSLDDATSY